MRDPDAGPDSIKKLFRIGPKYWLVTAVVDGKTYQQKSKTEDLAERAKAKVLKVYPSATVTIMPID